MSQLEARLLLFRLLQRRVRVGVLRVQRRPLFRGHRRARVVVVEELLNDEKHPPSLVLFHVDDATGIVGLRVRA